MSEWLLRIMYRENELQKRFMRFGDISLERIAAIAILSQDELFLFKRMGILK